MYLQFTYYGESIPILFLFPTLPQTLIPCTSGSRGSITLGGVTKQRPIGPNPNLRVDHCQLCLYRRTHSCLFSLNKLTLNKLTLRSAACVEIHPRFCCDLWRSNPEFGIGAHQISRCSTPTHTLFWSKCKRHHWFPKGFFGELVLWSCHKHPLIVKSNSISSAPFSKSQIFCFAISSHFHIQIFVGVKRWCNWFRDCLWKLTWSMVSLSASHVMGSKSGRQSSQASSVWCMSYCRIPA